MAPEEKQLGKTYVQEILELVEDVKKHIIIVTLLGLTSYVSKEVISIKNCKIELFKYSELQAAIGRHVLVPTYYVIPEQCVLNLLIYLHCEKKEDLPRMLDTDPVARYFNFESGTVLKLKHHIPDWPGLEYYRVVI
jgi:DNA-directed RNA polymerase subunit H (RpoH/RPB5)